MRSNIRISGKVMLSACLSLAWSTEYTQKSKLKSVMENPSVMKSAVTVSVLPVWYPREKGPEHGKV